METLPSMTYLQKWLRMEGLPSMTYLQTSCQWKCFKGNVFKEMVVDGRGSKCDIFTEKLQMERLPSMTYLQKRAKGPRWDWVSPDSLWMSLDVSGVSFKDAQRHSRDIQRHPETPRAAQSAKDPVPHIVTFVLDTRGVQVICLMIIN